MKKYLLAAVSLLPLATTSGAADLAGDVPVKAPLYSPAAAVNWAGVYVGVQGGLVRRDSSLNGSGSAEGPFIVNVDDRKTGGAVGALLGYNWQQGSFLYGLEGDWNWTRTKADHDPSEFIATFDVGWLATIRGRIGVTLNSTLFYATGGLAFGHVKNTFPIIIFNDGSLASAWIQDRTKAGWALGGGAEYMFSPHWTARAEFRYADLGKTSVACGIVLGAADSCNGINDGVFKNTLKLGLVGLNYKF
jgi:outer membrane immunogenic protein